jgi:hypothetical protein
MLPPPADAPVPTEAHGDHPFILEVPVRETDLWKITNRRRLLRLRSIALVLNVLLRSRIKAPPVAQRAESLWASAPTLAGGFDEVHWVQPFFSAPLGEAIVDDLTDSDTKAMEVVDADRYYSDEVVPGDDLVVPSDLDTSLSAYESLSVELKEKFDRAAFWFDMASRQWTVSMSASFATLVSAVESLTDRGVIHRPKCPECGELLAHEVPGATQRFKEFFESHAPGVLSHKEKVAMYGLRSGILHGSQLAQLDMDRALGWDPPWWNEREMNEALSKATRAALRHWLLSQG